MRITPFDKAIAAFLTGLVAFVVNLLQQSGTWTTSDTIALCSWLGSTGLVYLSENKPSTPVVTKPVAPPVL